MIVPSSVGRRSEANDTVTERDSGLVASNVTLRVTDSAR